MSVVVGLLNTQEGTKALQAALVEAQKRNTELVIVKYVPEDLIPAPIIEELSQDVANSLDKAGIAYSVVAYPETENIGESLILCAEEKQAQLVVIGIRQRTPTGKLSLGTGVQKILLEAPCPVLTVKV